MGVKEMAQYKKYFSIGVLILFLIVTTTNVLGINYNTIENNEIVLNFTFSEPTLEKIEINEQIFHRITVKELPNSGDIGKPCIPVKPVKVLLPQGTDINNIEIFTSDETLLGYDYNIERGGRLVPVSMANQKENHQKTTSYQSPPVNVESLYEKIGIYTMRGFSILHVNLFPVQYDVDSGRVSYFNEMKLVVDTKSAPGNRAFRGIPKDYEVVKGVVDNPSFVETYTNVPYKSQNNEVYDYVVITSSKFKNSGLEYNFQSLLDSKELKGLKTKIVTVGEIFINPDYGVNGEWGDNNPDNPFYEYEINGDPNLFNDKSAKIRNFIRFAYMEWETNYILLGGDADPENNADNIVPLRGLFANESGLPLNNYISEEEDDIPSDVYYACLDGNFNYDCDEHFGECADRNDLTMMDEADLYSEVWIGRACADSEDEVYNFVMKTLQYEQYTDVSDFDDILFVGEHLGSLFYYPYGGYYKDDMEHLVPLQYNLHKFYDYDHPDNNWHPEELAEEIYNIEPHMINHDGHGYVTYMFKTGSYFCYELTNEKPFFVYSHSCLTGSFDNWAPYGGYGEDDCIAEVLTCEIPYGAFACILNARYGLGSEDSPYAPSGGYDESFYEALFTENIKELGGANHYSKEDNVWRIDENGYRWCYYQTNLFGDPELRIKDPAADQPNKPSKPEGETNGNKGEEYTYTTSTTDPKESDLLYLFDWDDGTTSDWLGPFSSGETASGSHTWQLTGTYQVKVCAKNMDGVISEWSDPLSVSMPRNRLISMDLIEKIRCKLPRFFSLFYHFLNV
jgi:hypothetical protein